MTDEKPTQPSSLGFIDNPMAPDVFADVAIGFHLVNGMVKITFGSVRVNHQTSPVPVNHVVIGRLVMSVAGAQNLAVGLFDFLKSQGVDFSGIGPDGPKKAN
jgi:hypothetical protein